MIEVVEHQFGTVRWKHFVEMHERVISLIVEGLLGVVDGYVAGVAVSFGKPKYFATVGGMSQDNCVVVEIRFMSLVYVEMFPLKFRGVTGLESFAATFGSKV